MTPGAVRLGPLGPEHADAVLAFETGNRSYFAQWISDRGDAFFRDFTAVFRERLAEQCAGLGAYYVLVEPGGDVIGRVNLVFDGDGSADLGYRVAQSAAGRGWATWAVGEVCDLAARRFGLRRVRAATSTGNVASQRVLAKAGFAMLGPADPHDVGGKAGYRYERVLEVSSD